MYEVLALVSSSALLIVGLCYCARRRRVADPNSYVRHEGTQTTAVALPPDWPLSYPSTW